MKRKDKTEYGGDYELEAGVQPKPTSNLKAWERLRLAYLTGQPDNSEAKRDGGRAWTGQNGSSGNRTSGL